MRIQEFKKNSAAKLNESLAKHFGKKINLEAFSLEQLQDVRNRIRTKLSQFETNESYNSVQSESYQKTKLMLDVLNAAISERAHIVEAKCDDCGEDPCCCEEETNEAAKPDYIDIDGDGDKKEPMKKAAKDAKKKKPVSEDKINNPAYLDIIKNLLMRAKSTEEFKDYLNNEMDKDPKFGQWMNFYAKETALGKRAINVYYGRDVIGESIVREGAEDHAELVMAAKDMVDRLTGWMEDTAEMQTESMLELADAIRDEMGAEQSQTFTDTVKPALEALYAAMETTRVSLTSGVGMLTGESEPMDTMGAEDEMPMDDTAADMEMPVDAPAEDDFAADAAAAGGEEEAGREKRESLQRKRAMLETSRRLGAILSKKK